jgi:hypothetical protein
VQDTVLPFQARSAIETISRLSSVPQSLSHSSASPTDDEDDKIINISTTTASNAPTYDVIVAAATAAATIAAAARPGSSMNLTAFPAAFIRGNHFIPFSDVLAPVIVDATAPSPATLEATTALNYPYAATNVGALPDFTLTRSTEQEFISPSPPISNSIGLRGVGVMHQPSSVLPLSLFASPVSAFAKEMVAIDANNVSIQSGSAIGSVADEAGPQDIIDHLVFIQRQLNALKKRKDSLKGQLVSYIEQNKDSVGGMDCMTSGNSGVTRGEGSLVGMEGRTGMNGMDQTAFMNVKNLFMMEPDSNHNPYLESPVVNQEDGGHRD